MVSINTNLASLIVQSNLNKSSNALEVAIERMTTGFKLNGAKDNAAGYSINTSLTTKLGAYSVAEDNVAMGLDLVMTASDSLGLINSHLSRLRDLAEQAANGTYGLDSLSVIQSEADARIAEIERIMNNTEYNGIKLFNPFVHESGNGGAIPPSGGGTTGGGTTGGTTPDSGTTQPGGGATGGGTTGGTTPGGDTTQPGGDTNPPSGGVDDTNPDDTTPPVTGTASLTEEEAIAQGYTIIKTADELQAMRNNLSGKYILMDNIDLSGYDWEPVGRTGPTSGTYYFTGELNGNGYVIENLTIKGGETYRGLFAGVTDATIKNVALENVDISGDSSTGGLVSSSYGSTIIDNCSVTGKINGIDSAYWVGGLVGSIDDDTIISNCTVEIDVVGDTFVGGLVGEVFSGTINNCYVKGSVNGTASGGLVGYVSSATITNCWTSASVTCNGTILSGNVTSIGGLIGGVCDGAIIENCCATGNVTGLDSTVYVGGLVGSAEIDTQISNCYATGSVSGIYAGGLVGRGYYGEPALYTNVYYNTETTGQTDWIGQRDPGFTEPSGGISGVTTAELNALIANGTLPQFTFGTANSTLSTAAVLSNNTVPDVFSVNTLSLPVSIQTKALPEASSIVLQAGIDSSESSKISFDTSFELSLDIDLTTQTGAINALSAIDDVIKTVSAKQTEFGAVQNRLESALEQISVSYENLVSTRSTIRDADISEVSSEYIRQQILQQASATLLAAANQSPAFALQLL